MINSSTNIIVVGALGRMGSRIIALAKEDASLVVRCGADRASSKEADANFLLVLPSEISQHASCDVVIDFSSDMGTRDAISGALSMNAALLVGTTALSDVTLGLLKESAKKIPILVASNTSLGVAVLARLAAQAARALGPDYECSIVEAHHSKKKDAPSGTALTLAKAIRDAGHRLEDQQILAVRGGDVVGEHTIRFAGSGEYLELTHRATSRDLFARGALAAAKWLKGKPAGWYSIQDVIGVAEPSRS